MHSGNVGHAQDLDSLVRAATFLRDLDDLRFVIAGFGARHAEIVALARRLDVEDRSASCRTRSASGCPSRSRRRPARCRPREGPGRLRRPEPPLRDPLRGPARHRGCRGGQRDREARLRGRLRPRHRAGAPRAARAHHSRRSRRRLRPRRRWVAGGVSTSSARPTARWRWSATGSSSPSSSPPEPSYARLDSSSAR